MRNSVKVFTTVGVLIALAIAFEYFIAIPILPNAPFLLYSPGDLPLLIIGYFFGPIPGILGSALKAVFFALFRADGNGIWGMLMNFLASGTFVLVFSLIARKSKKTSTIVIGLVCGILGRTGIMIPANLIITPIVIHAPVEAVKKLLLPAIIPFNLIHSGINSILFGGLLPRLKSFFESLHG